MDFTISFLKMLYIFLSLLSPILIFLSVLILILAFIAGRREGWNFLNTIYWAAITATTVGYGDMRPLKKLSRMIAIAIAILGLMFTGVLVAATVSAATQSLDMHMSEQTIKQIKDKINEKALK
ncbi:potassium channel family protein [Agaribacterium sp. ZY112]|uniref:potassium channel family protein n=1 Tax=Agaribacterium sp. ZY112 TaxID=3233574 RepID=UPI0035262C63